jgi:hypothetical protein
MALDLPSTPQSAPPNFYAQAGKMAAGPDPGAAGGPGAKKPKDPDHEFLDMITKLLTVFSKMETMKPGGKDISKFTKSMADTAKDALKFVSSDTGDGGGQGGAAATPGDATGDAGGGGAATPPPPATDTGATA